MKILIWIFVTVSVLTSLGVGAAFLVSRHNANANQSGISVRVEPAALGDLVDTITAPGMIQAKMKVSISARVAARIVGLAYKEGDKVIKGDPDAKPPVPPSLLVKLDATDLEADLRSSQAHYNSQEAQLRVAKSNIESQKSQIESSQVQLEDAERDLKRQQQLLETKDVSQSIVDSAQAKVDQLRDSLQGAQHSLEGVQQNLEVLQFELQAADADIAKSKDNLSYTQIMSPINGTVTRVNAEVGELVVTGTMNTPGTVIMEVADLTKMNLEARVDETSIAQVKVGQKATVRIPAYQDKEFSGVVTDVALADTLDTTMGTNQRYFKAEILIDTKDQQIISGLNADADIETASYHDVIVVPSQAILGRPLDALPPGVRNAPEVDPKKTTATVVYRMVNGKATATPVTIGASDVTRTIIKSGLKAGDLVITGPFKVLDTLADGQGVTSDSPIAKATTEPTSGPATAPAASPSTKPTTGP